MLSSAQKFQTPAPPFLEIISVLLVSPHREDYVSLRLILHDDGWRISRCRNVGEASTHLRTAAPSIVVCERDLPDGCWRDLLRELESLPNPPILLVVSRHADENLWAEVLNLGGYDVLLKPFDRTEVTRVLDTAWRQWFRPASERPAQKYA